MPFVPFVNDTPAVPRAAFWDGCEVVTGGDGVVRVCGPHGSVEYPRGTEIRSISTLPPHWPPPVEPAEWDDEITDATRAEWREAAADMEESRQVERPAPRRAEAVEVSDETRAALLWIGDPANDRATISEWQARCEAAGVEWPASGLKADKIDTVRNAAAARALDLDIPWGAP